MPKINIDHDLLVDAAYDAGLEESSVRNYSGRGMYGDTCLGLIYESNGEVHRFYRALEEQLDDADEDGRSIVEEMQDSERHDSMGRRGIVYWSRVTVENFPEGDE